MRIEALNLPHHLTISAHILALTVHLVHQNRCSVIHGLNLKQVNGIEISMLTSLAWCILYSGPLQFQLGTLFEQQISKSFTRRI